MKQRPGIKTQAAEPVRLVRQIVDQHRKNSSDLEMRMAIWMNPKEPNVWQNGIELLEICENAVAEMEPDFRPSLIQPRWGRPGLKYILTSPRELTLDQKLSNGGGFYHKLRERLENGEAKVVFPSSKRSPVELLQTIVESVPAAR